MDISKQARDLSPGALRVLDTIANDGEASAPARVAAANSIIDRAYGKPVQATISVPVDRGAAAKLVALDDSALLALITAARIAQSTELVAPHQAQGTELVAISDSPRGVTPAFPSPTRQVEMGRRTYDSVATPVQQKAKGGGGKLKAPPAPQIAAPPAGESEFERMLRDPLLA